MYLNEITVAGNLGRDAESRTTPAGKEVVSFSLAHNEKGKDGRQDEMTWFNVNVFGGWCESARTLRKGDNVMVKGRLIVRKYKNKEGIEVTSVEIFPHVLAKLERQERRDSQSQRPPAQRQPQSQSRAPYQPPQSHPNFEDEIPF